MSPDDRNYNYTDEDLRLPKGEWVTRGCIQVFMPASPINPKEDTLDVIAYNLSKTFQAQERVVEHDICDICGCLVFSNEMCPQCLFLQTERIVAAAQNESLERSAA